MNITNKQEYDHEFLRGIIEDYKYSINQDEKEELFNEFINKIWGSSNKRRTLTKSIKFDVRPDLLDTEIGIIFDTWSIVEYKGYRSTCKENNWDALIRQKINNIYTIVFDKNIIIKKEYMDLIKTPRRLYYEWLNGRDFEPNILTEMIDDAIDESIKVKAKFEKEKIDYSWNDYKELINGMLRKCLDKCVLLEDYEDITNADSGRPFGHFISDHFYVSYICKCLEGMIRDWEKSYHHLPMSSRKGYKHCSCCGGLIVNTNNRRKYCQECAYKIKLIQTNQCKKNGRK